MSRVNRGLIIIQKWIMFISSLLIILSISLAVLLRYVLKMDLFGIEELLIIPIFLLYFVGSTFGTYENSHITADLLDSFVKNEKVLKFFRTLTSFISMIACSVFSYWAIQYFMWSVNKLEKTPGWHIPLFIPHGIVMIGFILMTIYFFMHFYLNLQYFFGKKVEG